MDNLDKYIHSECPSETHMVSTMFSVWLEAIVEMGTVQSEEAQDDLIWYVEHFNHYRKLFEEAERYEQAAIYRDLMAIANKHIAWDAVK